MKVFLIQILSEEDDNLFTYIGLNAIAAYLEKNNIAYDLFKGNVDHVLLELEKHVDQSDYNIIGINVMTSRFKESMDFIYKLRSSQNFNSSYIVAGGPHFTLIPESLPSEIDCAVIGEGEQTFLELIQTSRSMWKNVRGIVYSSEKGVIFNEPRELMDLDKLPFPRYESSKFKINDKYYNATAIYTSKGCPYNCVYCNVNNLYKKVQFNSAEYIFQLIKDRVTRGSNLIIICDDLFIGHKKRLKKLLGLMENSDLKVNFYIMGARANLVDEELVTDLVNLGVIQVNLGLESGSDKILGKLKNAVTVKDNYRAVELFHKAGIITYCMFMIGHPEETSQDIKDTIKLIKNTNVRSGEVFITTPMPKTKLWYDCGFENNIDDIGKLDFKHGHNKNICKYLTMNQLKSYQNKAMRIIGRKKLIDRVKRKFGVKRYLIDRNV